MSLFRRFLPRLSKQEQPHISREEQMDQLREKNDGLRRVKAGAKYGILVSSCLACSAAIPGAGIITGLVAAGLFIVSTITYVISNELIHRNEKHIKNLQEDKAAEDNLRVELEKGLAGKDKALTFLTKLEQEEVKKPHCVSRRNSWQEVANRSSYNERS